METTPFGSGVISKKQISHCRDPSVCCNKNVFSKYDNMHFFFSICFFFLTTFSVCFWSSGLWRPASRFYNLGLDTYGLWFIASTSLKKDDKDVPFACLPGMLSNRRGNVCDSILQTVKLCIKSSSSPTSVSLLANIHWTLFCDKHCAWLLTFISSCNLMKSPCSLHFVSEETQA